jgi:hypothetical protein
LQRIRAGRAAMRQVFEDPQALQHDRMRFAALDVRDESEPAGIVLVGRVV